MPNTNVPFLSGQSRTYPGPLARYLPPLPVGAAARWLNSNLPTGSWILDPFGSSPWLALEAARAGYRVLVAVNNPVVRGLLETAAASPSQAEMRAALSELAASYKGEERLEPHIRRLYETECANCSSPVEAEAFLWEKHAPAPYARIYHCHRCGDAGERPTSPHDQEKAARFASGGLHRARAIERVAPGRDPDRIHAEEALSVYLPRAVYVLFTLINKMDGLALPPQRRRCLNALLLHACDHANLMWSHPGGRERPRQISIPQRFRENNIWRALEQGTSLWGIPDSIDPSPVPCSTWPNLPEGENGIVLFGGRLKELTGVVGNIPLRAALTTLPRPNQAFWTLSALWSGWLWGAEAAGPLKMVLRRRRYDWAWHTAALSAGFSSLASLLPEETPFLAFSGEAEPGLITAALLAGETAGFSLAGLALRPEDGQAQFSWVRSIEKSTKPSPINKGKEAELAREAGKAYLLKRGEPADYLSLHAAALAALAKDRLLQVQAIPETPSGPADPKPAVQYSQLQSLIKQTFSWRGGFLRFAGSDQSLEVGQWWLRDDEGAQPPLADRVEAALVGFLSKHPGCSQEELEQALYEAFPGLLTPEPELIEACLESYAIQDPEDSGNWRLRQQDLPAARRRDLNEAREMVSKLGEQLGFTNSRIGIVPRHDGQKITTATPFLWLDKQGKASYVFYITASASFGKILLSTPSEAPNQLIVLPGSRANLALYKLRSDPRLQEATQKGWRFIKYRLLRHLAASQVTEDTLDEHLTADPLTANTVQIRLPGFS